MHHELKLRALVLRDGDTWVMVGLEHFIVTQAKNLDELQERFDRTLRETIAICKKEGVPLLANFQAAPKEYWEMFEAAGSHLTASKKQMPELVEDVRVAA